MVEAKNVYLADHSRGDATFDVLIASCGFESRSIHVATQLAGRYGRALAYGYTDNQVLSFEQNLNYFNERTSVAFPIGVDEFAGLLESELRPLLAIEGVTRLAVDISSMDRERLGATVRLLTHLSETSPLDVEYFYAVGTFDSLEESPEATVLANRPLAGFEGWTSDPTLPLACVIGLGFENMLALAALEMLEPSRTVALIAESDDVRFQARVRVDNASLMRSSDIAEVAYSVDHPFKSLHLLEDIVHALSPHFRVVMVPLGPKIFALLAIVIALEYGHGVAVWRVSANQGRTPRDRSALGPVTSLRVLMGAQDTDTEAKEQTKPL